MTKEWIDGFLDYWIVETARGPRLCTAMPKDSQRWGFARYRRLKPGLHALEVI